MDYTTLRLLFALRIRRVAVPSRYSNSRKILLDAEIELLETAHRGTAYFRHCRKYRLHGGAQLGRESEFHEVVERVHFTVPISSFRLRSGRGSST